MKRLALFLIAILGACVAPAAAQIPPPPTPSPDPHTYSDPAMNFTAPADAVLVGRRQIPVDQLSNEFETIAIWVLHAGKEDARTIQIQMEAYEGPPSQWEGQFESQSHSSGDGTLIRNKTPITLLNGMPAYFVEIAYGAGFDARKEFAIVWADGQRGVVLSETTRMGDAGADEARAVLKQVTAVRYPLDQP